MDIFAVRRGTALDLTITLTDARNDPITTYSGAETLTAAVWPGGSLAPAFSPSAAWVDPAAGTIALAHSASQTATLARGRYRGTLDLADPALGPLEAYSWALDVLTGPASGLAAPSYCSYPDLLEYGRSWLADFQSDDDDAGFGRQCGRARSWLDDLIVAAWEAGVGPSPSLGDPGYGASWGGQGPGQLPSAWLRATLDAGGLIVRDLVVEITSNKALGLICQGQAGPSESGAQFRALARAYHHEAAQLARTLRAEVDTSGLGLTPGFAINLGCGSMR